MAEASGETTSWRFAAVSDREAVIAMVTDAAELASVRLTPPELSLSPVVFRRDDGTSVFRPVNPVIFTSEVQRAAEDRLLERFRDLTGPTVTVATVKTISRKPDADSLVLGEDQAQALTRIAVSGRVLDVLAGTLSLDRITSLAQHSRAKVLLVGDYVQLQPVDAGGAFSMLAQDRTEAVELVDVHRFHNAWEKLTSLDLRHGHTSVIDTYLAHGRIQDGDAEAMTDAAYAARRADRSTGLLTVLIAETREQVIVLNERARADLLVCESLVQGWEVELRDGIHAGVGDTIITRRNDRAIAANNGHDWVRNDDLWAITDVRDDGSITIGRPERSFGGVILLPAATLPSMSIPDTPSPYTEPKAPSPIRRTSLLS